MTTKMSRTCRLFYSYSHRDEALRVRLGAHLTALEREGLIVGWHDRCISAGREWAGEISAELDAADIILLLISTDFIASGYCHDVELKRALERHDEGSAVVIPVFLKPCDWKWLSFGKLQGVPADAKPITKWRNRDEAFAAIAEEIRNVSMKLITVNNSSMRSENFFQSKIRISNLSPRNYNFTGREDLLLSLGQALSAGPVALTPAALYGLGGIGKSQTALEYAWRHEANYNVIWWLRTEQQETLVSGLADLASKLGISKPSETDVPAMAKAAVGWLASHSGWLLVFDNAISEEAVRDWLPAGPGAVIVTSRNSIWLAARPLEVDGLPENEAVAFLTSRSGDIDVESAKALAGELDRLPLALEQAAAFILERHWKIARYLKVFQVRKAELLKLGIALNYPATVATTWELSFRALEDDYPAAAHLLRLCAFLAPDDIPLDLLRPGSSVLISPLKEALADDLATGNMVAALLRYSLVKAKDETLFVHRLVQVVARERLSQEERKEWAGFAVKLIDRVFSFEEADRATWGAAERLLPHAETVADYGAASDIAAELGSLLLRAGRCLDNRALHDRAQVLKHSARALFDHAALGIAVVREDGKIVQVNQALVSMFNYAASELVRMKWTELVHPDDREMDAHQARRLIKRDLDDYSRESRFLHKDGHWFWGRITASLVPGESDELYSVLMIEDIDDRKRAEANLSLFRKVMDASHEAIAILSPSGHILYANSAYGRLFGVAPGAVSGSHYRSYFTPSSQVVLERAVGPALLRGESWEGVMEASDTSGRTFPLWQRAGLLRDESGQVQFFFAFMHDNTAQQLFEDELFDAKEAAEEANMAKTHFLAAASHDLRQPMQALAMFVAVLADRCIEPRHTTLVNRIQDSVHALEGLLNSLLDVSKLEAGLVVPIITQFPVTDMMDRLAAEFEPLCQAEGLELRMVQCRKVVCSDSDHLERILRNLLNNAIRFTRTGRILFGCRRRGKDLVFEVWDTGIGIPEAEMKNIFREFHQVGNPERDRRQGLGLGLAIVERLCALLGHQVRAASQEGRGSRFTVITTLGDESALENEAGESGSFCSAKSVISVIEDDPDVLEGICLLLESWGHIVVGAGSGEDAIRRILDIGYAPDLIIADYRLQNGETGGQAISRMIVRSGAWVPAIILSDETTAESLRQIQATGYPLLHKPFQAEALRAAIDEALTVPTVTRRRLQRRTQSELPADHAPTVIPEVPNQHTIAIQKARDI